MNEQLNNQIVEEIDENNEEKNYTWENEGRKIINSKKIYLTDEDIIIIKYCFKNSTIPNDLREEYWLLVTGAKELKLKNPNYYNTILNHFPENPISIKNENQVLLDIHRTFPEDDFFTEEKLESLKNILIAYSRRNCTLGYCQGFNYIVGKILKVVSDEENVFWIFVQILENILPINYYYNSVGIIIDNSIFVEQLKINDKDLMDHFVKYNFELLVKNILYKWLICLFSQNIKDDLLFLIWDIFFIEGTPILFETIKIILEKNKEKLLEITQIDKLINLFDSVHKLELLNQHEGELLKELLKYKSMEKSFITKERKKLYKETTDSMKSLNKNKYKIKDDEICCENWDNCYYIKKKFDSDDFIVYQRMEKMEIIDNFYQEKVKRCNSLKNYENIFQKEMSEFYEYENLIVQRRAHKCPESIKNKIRERMKSCDEINKNKNKYEINDYFKKIQKRKKKINKNIDKNGENDDYYEKILNSSSMIWDYY